MGERTLAEVFAPGEFIKEELEARGWTQDDLGEILGRPTRLVNELISGKRGITPETAKGLGEAFGTSPQLWMNLESSYRLSQVNVESTVVARRASLFAIAPIRAMIKRNWIDASRNIESLEMQICEFYNIGSIREQPQFFSYVARKSTSYSCGLTPTQNAWLFRASYIANCISVPKYTKSSLNTAFSQLKPLLGSINSVGRVPSILNNAGIRLIFIEPLPKSKIDGATFWIDDSPVIVLSLRYDRIDWFWYTLMHELAHVKYEDGKDNNKFALDANLAEERIKDRKSRPAYEFKADEFASEYLVPQEKLEAFIGKNRPIFSKNKVRKFSTSIGVHPGLVVGQIHYREKNYSFGREMLEKIRRVIIEQAVTDGWGTVFQCPNT